MLQELLPLHPTLPPPPQYPAAARCCTAGYAN